MTTKQTPRERIEAALTAYEKASAHARADGDLGIWVVLEKRESAFSHACSPTNTRALLADTDKALQSMTLELDRMRAQRDKLRAAGSGLSNIAFNLCQRIGDRITGGEAASMDKCRRAWDAALAPTGDTP